ncbi:MAG TPA: antitoxin VapB family protein [Candidatus Nitrosotenuis sp.]|nr:antitoxin VapB family protein [Candidatus Nitrosotenuis sp.]
MVTSIQLENKTKARLEKMKSFPKESYDDVVNRLLNMAKDDEGVLSKHTIKNIEKSLAEIKAGKVISHKDVKQKLGLK